MRNRRFGDGAHIFLPSPWLDRMGNPPAPPGGLTNRQEKHAIAMTALYLSIAAMIVIVGVLMFKLDDKTDPFDQPTTRR